MAEKSSLAASFGAPPLTVLDARQGYWRARKRAWIARGIRGEMGRDCRAYSGTAGMLPQLRHIFESFPPYSVFDPVLCELVYRWFCPRWGTILDPFAGESTKGLVAASLGHPYTGIELRTEQVAANEDQARALGLAPRWICGDSARLDGYLSPGEAFDLVFTSPPYFDLEVYSNRAEDGSARRSYAEFMEWYRAIFAQAARRLKPNRFLVVKVGEIRDRRGACRNFVGDTIKCFMDLGLHYYNEAVLITSYTSAPLRARGMFVRRRKMCKVHQNVLVFFAGDLRAIPEALGEVADAALAQ